MLLHTRANAGARGGGGGAREAKWRGTTDGGGGVNCFMVSTVPRFPRPWRMIIIDYFIDTSKESDDDARDDAGSVEARLPVSAVERRVRVEADHAAAKLGNASPEVAPRHFFKLVVVECCCCCICWGVCCVVRGSAFVAKLFWERMPHFRGNDFFEENATPRTLSNPQLPIHPPCALRAFTDQHTQTTTTTTTTTTNLKHELLVMGIRRRVAHSLRL
jgi:hypothetical protein